MKIFLIYLFQGIIYLTGFGFSNRGKRHTLNNPNENPYLKKEVWWLYQTSRSQNTGSRLIVDIMIMFFQGSLDIIDSGMQKKIPIFENKNMQVPIDSRFIHTTLYLYSISYLVNIHSLNFPQNLIFLAGFSFSNIGGTLALKRSQMSQVQKRNNYTSFLSVQITPNIFQRVYYMIQIFFISHRI